MIETSRPRADDSVVNPVLAGDYPDPSVIRDGDVYYLVASSFVYYPGLVIWRSTDLVDWTPVGPALTEPVGSVYAPELVAHDGRYFIYFAVRTIPEMPAPDGGPDRAPLTTYVIHSDAIEGPWSAPVDLGISDQIDPGHAVGEDGRRYLYVSEGVLIPLSDDGLRREGPDERLYDGWAYPADWEVESFSLEGPKIVRRDGWFYLFSAEGGTAGPPTSHMVVVARSRSIKGPWENAPDSPLVRTRSVAEGWWSRGHGTPVQDGDGGWWLVEHGYESGRRTLGRQTIVEPLSWPAGEWPRAAVEDPSGPMRRPVGTVATPPAPDGRAGAEGLGPFGARFSVFTPRPDYRDRVRFGQDGIALDAQGGSVVGSSPLVFNAADRDYEVTAELTIDPSVVAGLLLFYNDAFHCGIGFDGESIRGYALGKETPGRDRPACQGRTLHLRVTNVDQVGSFFSSQDGADWTRHRSFEIGGYNHNVAGKFLSLRPAFFATGLGSATIRAFHYRGL